MQAWIAWMKQRREKSEAELKMISKLREKGFRGTPLDEVEEYDKRMIVYCNKRLVYVRILSKA
jgi:uncharacterized protein (UPF0248 family)